MIRQAVIGDLPALVEMGRALHAESPRYRHMAFSEDKLVRLFHDLQGTLLSKPGVCFVAERDGYVIGMTVGIIAARWFSEDLFLSELTMYVRPEHRGGTAFRRLVDAMEQWAAAEKIAPPVFGVSTDVHPEKTVAAYERIGYQLAGYTMVKKNG